MSKVILHIDECGKLSGLDEANERAYARFRQKLDNLRAGDTLSFDFKIPRSPKFHKLHMKMHSVLFEAQDSFADRRVMRKWIETGAGHCDFFPGKDGLLIAIPRSINYESLDDVEFGEHHASVLAFLRTAYASSALWPHMSAAGAEGMMESIIGDFA